MKLNPTDDQELRLIRAADYLREHSKEHGPILQACSVLGQSKAARNLLMDTAAHVVFELGLRAAEAARLNGSALP